MPIAESPIASAWRQLRHHAAQCEICVEHVQRLAAVPDDPRAADAEIHPRLCPEGRELHAAWIAEKSTWLLGPMQERRRKLGMIGLDPAAAELRARALDLLDPKQFAALLALPDEPREGQIRALEAAQRRRHVLREVRAVARSSEDDRILYRWWCDCGAEAAGDSFSAEEARGAWRRHLESLGLSAAVPKESTSAEERECEGCGMRFVPRFPRQVYHDNACRQRAWRNR